MSTLISKLKKKVFFSDKIDSNAYFSMAIVSINIIST